MKNATLAMVVALTILGSAARADNIQVQVNVWV